MLMFTLAISCSTSSNLLNIQGPNIPGSYAILFFTASDFTSITSHIHNLSLFLLWLGLLILSGVFPPLFSSNMLGTYRSVEFIFQCHIFLPFHTVHIVFLGKMLIMMILMILSTEHQPLKKKQYEILPLTPTTIFGLKDKNCGQYHALTPLLLT